jgi:hypothetical protein
VRKFQREDGWVGEDEDEGEDGCVRVLFLFSPSSAHSLAPSPTPSFLAEIFRSFQSVFMNKILIR